MRVSWAFSAIVNLYENFCFAVDLPLFRPLPRLSIGAVPLSPIIVPPLLCARRSFFFPVLSCSSPMFWCLSDQQQLLVPPLPSCQLRPGRFSQAESSLIWFFWLGQSQLRRGFQFLFLPAQASPPFRIFSGARPLNI